ncbi:MAG: isoprenyl transferase [Candidatus Delongbacteria bacterium]|jgi:undecaprenyl diphosphate synthase|nr:isoprenyl transferase [Candidatus Delongbacteria bacterium]
MELKLEYLQKKVEEHGKIPMHVAIIMDGNGRWAMKQGMNRVNGHVKGVNSVRDVLEISTDIGVQHLTIYVFSKENWNRPEFEVNSLMSLLVNTIAKEINSLMERNIRVKLIGEIQDLPDKARQSIVDIISETENNTGMTLQLAISYSGREEIINAVNSIIESGKKDITEEDFSKYLYTANLPDPELLIRTGGDFRVSNFLLWQIAYTEFYITDILWPEFSKYDFLQAIDSYQNRERRFGKTSAQITDKTN